MFGSESLQIASRANHTAGRTITSRQSRLLIGIFVSCLCLLVGIAGIAGVASAENSGTAIDSCQAINESGSYYLNTSLTSGSSQCIGVNATDVVFDGHGESIEKFDTALKITATTNASNITVRNLTIRDAADEGVRAAVGSNSTRNLTVSNVTMENVDKGFYVPSTSESTPRVEFAIRNSSINETTTGVYVLKNDVGQYDVELEDTVINTTNGDNGVEFSLTQNGTDLNLSMVNNTIESEEKGVFLNLERSHATTDLELQGNEINATGTSNDYAVHLKNSQTFGDINTSTDVTATSNTLESNGTSLFLQLNGADGSRDIEFVNNTIEASDTVSDIKGYDVDAGGENTSVNFTAVNNNIDSEDSQDLTLEKSNQTLNATIKRNTITKSESIRKGIRIDADGDRAPANVSVLNNTFTESGTSTAINLGRDNATMDVDIRGNDANDIMFVNYGGENSNTDFNVTNNTVNASGTGISLDETSDESNQSTEAVVSGNTVNGTGSSSVSEILVDASAPSSTANITVTDNKFNETNTNEGLLVNADGDDMIVDAVIRNNTVSEAPDIAGIKTTVNGQNTVANVSLTNNTVDAKADAVSLFPRGDDQTLDIAVEDNDLNVTTTGSDRNGILFGETERNSTLTISAINNTINSTSTGIDIDPGHDEGNGTDPIDIDLRENVINASTKGVIIRHVGSSEQLTDRNVTVSMDGNTIEDTETGVDMGIQNSFGTDNVTLVENRIDVTENSLFLTLDGGEMDLNFSAANNTLESKNKNGARLIFADSGASGSPGTRDVNLSDNNVTAGDEGIYLQAERNGLTVNFTALDNNVTSTDQYDPGIFAEVSTDQMIVDADISENEIDVNGEGIDVELFSDKMNTTVTVSENVVAPGASTGVALRGGDGTAQNATWDVSDNTIDQAETGIYIEKVKMRDAGDYDVTLRGNNVTNASTTGLKINPTIGSGASSQSGTVEIERNNLSSDATTVQIENGPVAGINLSNNRFDANGWGVENLNTTSGYVDATDNYWGASDGPGSPGTLEDPVTGAIANGSGSNVTERGGGVSNVHFDPVLTSPPDLGGAADFTISIDSTNSPVSTNETLTIDATVENTGGQQGTQDVNLTINGTQRDSTTVPLDSGNNMTVSLDWTTDSGDAGSYTATVKSENDSDSTAVTVDTATAENFTATIDSTNAPITEGETLTVDATIENTGTANGSQTVTLSTNGTERESTTLSLNSSESQPVTLNWSTSDGDDGSYTATVETADDNATTSVDVTTASDDGDEDTTTGSSGGGGGGGSPTTDEDGIEETPDTAETTAIEGSSVEFETAERVSGVSFDEEASGSVEVQEYEEPPASVVDSVSEVVNDGSTTEDESGGGSDDGSTGGSTPNVVTVADISPTDPDTEQSSATVEFEVDRGEFDDPNNAVIFHETDDGWTEVETTVEATDGETMSVEGRIDSFSLFAVAEIESDDTSSTQIDGSNSNGDDAATTDSAESNSGGLPLALLGVLVVGIAGAVVFVLHRRGEM